MKIDAFSKAYRRHLLAMKKAPFWYFERPKMNFGRSKNDFGGSKMKQARRSLKLAPC